MEVKEYVGDLNGGSLLITETRIITEFLLKKLDREAWDSLIIKQNILQKKSRQTAFRNLHTIRNRLEGLGEDFMKALLTSGERAYVQMLMLALLVHSPIVADFMRQELAEARRTYKPSLAANAWDEFYDARARAYLELGKYADGTINKMGRNAIKSLVDCAYLSDSKTRKIQPVYLVPEVKSWLLQFGREDLIEVMECTI